MRDIKEMAKEAGFSSAVGKHIALDEDLERFAGLVRADEREACARECEDGASTPEELVCAKLIRAREQALDKRAENARELGLDYEPAQQEPVAYLCENAVGHKYFRWKKPSGTYKPIALYIAPQPAVPDPIHHTDTSETMEYIQGWNDCRQAMLAS